MFIVLTGDKGAKKVNKRKFECGSAVINYHFCKTKKRRQLNLRLHRQNHRVRSFNDNDY